MSTVVGNEDGLQTSNSLVSEWLRSLEPLTARSNHRFGASLQITQLNACWSCVRKCVTLCTASTPFATSFSLLKGAAKVPHWCQCCCHCNLQWDRWWPFQEMTSLSISCSCCGLQPAPYGLTSKTPSPEYSHYPAWESTYYWKERLRITADPSPSLPLLLKYIYFHGA